MEEDTEGLALLDMPGQAFDTTIELLTKVGIEPSPFASQLILLIVTGVILAWCIRKAWPLKTYATSGLVIGILVCALVAASIIGHWAYLSYKPLPDHIFGKVIANDLVELRIGLTDFQGQAIPSGSGAVDQESGDFVLRYQVAFGDRPRQLKVSQTGCKAQHYPISRSKLRAQADFILNYQCERE